jgi:hypothetical protein
MLISPNHIGRGSRIRWSDDITSRDSSVNGFLVSVLPIPKLLVKSATKQQPAGTADRLVDFLNHTARQHGPTLWRDIAVGHDKTAFHVN